MRPEDALRVLKKLSKKHALKTIYKYTETVDNPYFLEALIVQLQARQRQLNPDFHATTPWQIHIQQVVKPVPHYSLKENRP